MAIHEKHIEELVARYIKDGDVIAVGTGSHAETFLKKLALYEEEQGIKVSVVPASLRLAEIASSMGVRIASLGDEDIDIAVEFADLVDEQYNYIKRDSRSLVRDKMIAQGAETLILVADEDAYVKKLHGVIPFEIAVFGWQRTLHQLEGFGKAEIRKKGGAPEKNETGHYMVDVDVSMIYSIEELDYAAKCIPGVLETGLFIGYADKVILHNKKIRVESRI